MNGWTVQFSAYVGKCPTTRRTGLPPTDCSMIRLQTRWTPSRRWSNVPCEEHLAWTVMALSSMYSPGLNSVQTVSVVSEIHLCHTRQLRRCRCNCSVYSLFMNGKDFFLREPNTCHVVCSRLSFEPFFCSMLSVLICLTEV